MTEHPDHLPTSSSPQLGRLDSVNVRQIWPHEAHAFTPWLLDNPDVLSDALGIEVEFEAAEHRVGGFALDLIGRDLAHDAVLIVENQLEGTNHNHLGQILTYAAGTDASTIVWIATSFREEHRQVLDWLNELTGTDVRFFGIELTAVRIGDSAAAPLLRIVAEPNDWQKEVRTNTQAAARGGLSAEYHAFWTRYLEVLAERHPEWKGARRPQPRGWLDFRSPIPSVRINPGFAQGDRLRHELYIDTGDADRNLVLFNAFRDRREAVEGAYGAELDFEELPERRASRIAEYREGHVSESERWDEFIDWLIDRGERMRRAIEVVRPHLQ